MFDPRMKTLASNLVNYSVAAKPGDKVLIETTDVPAEFTEELIRQVYAAGAYPFVETYKGKVEAALRSGTSEEHSKMLADFAGYRMSKMDCYIGVRGNENAYDLSGVSEDKAGIYSRLYSYPRASRDARQEYPLGSPALAQRLHGSALGRAHGFFRGLLLPRLLHGLRQNG